MHPEGHETHCLCCEHAVENVLQAGQTNFDRGEPDSELIAVEDVEPNETSARRTAVAVILGGPVFGYTT